MGACFQVGCGSKQHALAMYYSCSCMAFSVGAVDVLGAGGSALIDEYQCGGLTSRSADGGELGMHGGQSNTSSYNVRQTSSSSEAIQPHQKF
jgi:hypothetical protein